jgi:hypothetical protein
MNHANPCYDIEFGLSGLLLWSTELQTTSEVNRLLYLFNGVHYVNVCIYETAKTGCVKIHSPSETIWQQFFIITAVKTADLIQFLFFLPVMCLLLLLVIFDNRRPCLPVMSEVANLCAWWPRRCIPQPSLVTKGVLGSGKT